MILSRGMDPLVLDPSQCHTHPAVPARWPTTAQLARYVADARRQLLAAVAQGVDTGAPGNCGTADANGHGGESVAIGTCQASTSVPMHALCMALEHERQHQETTCIGVTAHTPLLWPPAPAAPHTARCCSFRAQVLSAGPAAQGRRRCRRQRRWPAGAGTLGAQPGGGRAG